MATLERVKIDVEELVSTSIDPITFYSELIKHWKAVDFPIPGEECVPIEDGVIKTYGEGVDAGRKIQVMLDIEPTDSGLRIWSRIEYPSSKFWWVVCLTGIPFGYGLGLLGLFFVLDMMADKPDGAKGHFEKIVKHTAESFPSENSS